MDRKKVFSDELRQAIEHCGKTRYALSKRTGISQSVLSRFVNGKSGLSMANLDLLCEAIGVRLVVDKRTSKKKGM